MFLIKDSIRKYYEYVQFKRALFNCTEMRYDEATGRICEMSFVFNGNFR